MDAVGPWGTRTHGNPKFSTSVRWLRKTTGKGFLKSCKPKQIRRLRNTPADERYPPNFGRGKADGWMITDLVGQGNKN